MPHRGALRDVPVFGSRARSASFTIRLGDVDLTPDVRTDEYGVADNDVYGGSVDAETDVAMLTLDRRAPDALIPDRVVDADRDRAVDAGDRGARARLGRDRQSGDPSLRAS